MVGVLLTGRAGAGRGRGEDTELAVVLLVVAGAAVSPPLLELMGPPLLLPLFLADTLLSSDWLLQQQTQVSPLLLSLSQCSYLRCLLFRSSWWLWLWLAVWPSTGLLPDTELVLLAVSLASTLCGSGAPI